MQRFGPLPNHAQLLNYRANVDRFVGRDRNRRLLFNSSPASPIRLSLNYTETNEGDQSQGLRENAHHPNAISVNVGVRKGRIKIGPE